MKNELGRPRGTGVWWAHMMEIDHLKYSGVDGNIILKLKCKKWGGKARTGMIWLRIGTGGGHL